MYKLCMYVCMCVHMYICPLPIGQTFYDLHNMYTTLPPTAGSTFSAPPPTKAPLIPILLPHTAVEHHTPGDIAPIPLSILKLS